MSDVQIYEGVLTARYMAGTFWTLVTEQATYELRGPVPDLASGVRVRVTATPAAAGFGFNMVGPILEVVALEVLESPLPVEGETADDRA